MEDSRPKSVLVNSLSVCISLLDPKRLTLGVYHTYNRQITQGPTVTANPETVEGMLESLSKVPPLMLVFDFLVNLTLTFHVLPFFFLFSGNHYFQNLRVPFSLNVHQPNALAFPICFISPKSAA